jgi:hypothetical protein
VYQIIDTRTGSVVAAFRTQAEAREGFQLMQDIYGKHFLIYFNPGESP